MAVTTSNHQLQLNTHASLHRYFSNHILRELYLVHWPQLQCYYL